MPDTEYFSLSVEKASRWLDEEERHIFMFLETAAGDGITCAEFNSPCATRMIVGTKRGFYIVQVAPTISHIVHSQRFTPGVSRAALLGDTSLCAIVGHASITSSRCVYIVDVSASSGKHTTLGGTNNNNILASLELPRPITHLSLTAYSLGVGLDDGDCRLFDLQDLRTLSFTRQPRPQTAAAAGAGRQSLPIREGIHIQRHPVDSDEEASRTSDVDGGSTQGGGRRADGDPGRMAHSPVLRLADAARCAISSVRDAGTTASQLLTTVAATKRGLSSSTVANGGAPVAAEFQQQGFSLSAAQRSWPDVRDPMVQQLLPRLVSFNAAPMPGLPYGLLAAPRGAAWSQLETDRPSGYNKATFAHGTLLAGDVVLLDASCGRAQVVGYIPGTQSAVVGLRFSAPGTGPSATSVPRFGAADGVRPSATTAPSTAAATTSPMLAIACDVGRTVRVFSCPSTSYATPVATFYRGRSPSIPSTMNFLGWQCLAMASDTGTTHMFVRRAGSTMVRSVEQAKWVRSLPPSITGVRRGLEDIDDADDRRVTAVAAPPTTLDIAWCQSDTPQSVPRLLVLHAVPAKTQAGPARAAAPHGTNDICLTVALFNLRGALDGMASATVGGEAGVWQPATRASAVVRRALVPPAASLATSAAAAAFGYLSASLAAWRAAMPSTQQDRSGREARSGVRASGGTHRMATATDGQAVASLGVPAVAHVQRLDGSSATVPNDPGDDFVDVVVQNGARNDAVGERDGTPSRSSSSNSRTTTSDDSDKDSFESVGETSSVEEERTATVTSDSHHLERRRTVEPPAPQHRATNIAGRKSTTTSSAAMSSAPRVLFAEQTEYVLLGDQGYLRGAHNASLLAPVADGDDGGVERRRGPSDGRVSLTGIARLLGLCT